MLSIIGGTYREICQEPSWNELYGSGLRAAIALANLTSGTQLFTLIGSDERRELERKAKSFDVALHANSIAATVRFIYNHPLSTPSIYPSVEKLFTQKQKINVTEENILIFGMLEADSVASADYAVYDPQSPNNPRPFNLAGSTAKHLAVILNYWEAKQLTRQDNLDAMGQHLLDGGAEVVVIKQGSAGASVFEASKRTNIAAYQTTNVWPIGSGDIFSAVFAHYWAEQRSSASEAADHASLATAFYCQTQTLPIPKDQEVIASLNLKYLPSRGHICKNIYLAGPFFTMAERWLINESRQALQQTGNTVFSPLHDVGHGVADVVVPLDLEALNTCDIVFAIVDGLDSGTLFEVGYARAQGKRVVSFVQNEAPENLKMLQGSDCIICSDFSTAVYTINWLP